MLTYKIRLGKDDFKMEEIVWREKYLSPDLSFVSGVTDTEYHLEKYKAIPSSNSFANMDSTLLVECENVHRQGYIVVEGKKYHTIDVSPIDYYMNSTNKVSTKALFINGKYFYYNKLEGRDTSGYTITNLLTLDGGTITDVVIKEASLVDTDIKIDTLYWIENGHVDIDGHRYIYDRNESDNGTLRYLENGKALDPSQVGGTNVVYYPYETTEMYDVTKFKLSKNAVMNLEFDDVSFCRYHYFVSYKGYECPVIQKFSADAYSFVCEVPEGLLSGSGITDNKGVKEFPLYYIMEYGEYGPEINYESAVSGGCYINSEKYSEHFVGNLNDLKNVYSFIYIKTEEKAFFKVQHDVMNGNDGNEMLLSMNSEHCPLRVGDKVNFKMLNADYHECIVFNSADFNGENEEYIIHNGVKYSIEANICDKVLINKEEYIITYNNGKVVGNDCLVLIGDEEVPMKITEVSPNGGTLKRYGRIVKDGIARATDVTYSIKPYSGVTINNERYLQYVVDSNNKYVEINKPVEYEFVITEKIGNSSYVCVPHINENNFTDDFVRYFSREMCSQVINNKGEYSLETKNKIFGDREITDTLVFDRVLYPTSSDDYYDLFSDLKIYSRNAYALLPISLTKDVAMNALQEDLVRRDFFEKEKERALNEIVDMEKDVYTPKYISNNDTEQKDKYIGSDTVFKPITEINFNFHFRTRDMSSWKINDGNNRIDSESVADNWFVTDYHPYCDLLKIRNDTNENVHKKYGKILMESSDLMGYLYFTNDDIFYQRDKVGKSFIRLSYYDSTDPQTQSLLATSCVFVDEHKLFKKFIDNSRKNEMVFGSTSTPTYGDNVEKIYTLNKISVTSEFLCNRASGCSKNIYEDYQTGCRNAEIYNEKHRLSSRLSVNNKYETDTSSEGFYLYIFKEYSENLHPKPIYMKIEYNHAGIGKMLPFLIPMKWEQYDDDLTNKMFPKEAYTFEKMNNNELAEFKKGIPLSYVYAQTYIPLYAVYDFKNKEYAYVFDSRYVQVDESDSGSTVNLNLFELKVKDESNILVSKDDQEAITLGKQKRAVINVNEKQFNKDDFNYKVE